MRKETIGHAPVLSGAKVPAASGSSGSFLPATRAQPQRVPAPRRLAGGGKSTRQLTGKSLVYLETVRTGYLIPVEAIKIIEADHKRSRVYFDKHAVTLSSSLQELEMRLPADLFVRANRAQILNTSYVASAEELPHGMLRLVLQGGFHGPILLSRRRAVLFKQRCVL